MEEVLNVMSTNYDNAVKRGYFVYVCQFCHIFLFCFCLKPLSVTHFSLYFPLLSVL